MPYRYPPVVVFEAGPPVGCPQQRLQSAGQVDEAVAHEEEHGDDGSDLVQVTDQDTNFRDNCRERRDKISTQRHSGTAITSVLTFPI